MDRYSAPHVSYGYPGWQTISYLAPARSGPPELRVAGPLGRSAARAVDLSVVVLALFTARGAGMTSGLLVTPILLVGLAYEPLMTWRFGTTIGKRCFGLRVVRLDDGDGLSLGRALWRWVCVVVSCVVPVLGLVSGLRYLTDEPYHQCLHDKAAGSVVVRGKS
ncbi:RDD family protein [Streptomyces sp. SAJ15]|uniref:RDD family protein n=1 Tax=Streptomyces sp. SAJ15 TaxID=2011095 RepID=UPI00118555A6|nr:RDD family protein [Streptomyces sp. SAJ15]TVL91027.1 hypothetical protein CD790_17085 [Streptomyces sp. SAJ15]